MKRLAMEAQDYYDRLKYAQQSPMSKEALSKFETEYAILQAKFIPAPLREFDNGQ